LNGLNQAADRLFIKKMIGALPGLPGTLRPTCWYSSACRWLLQGYASAGEKAAGKELTAKVRAGSLATFASLTLLFLFT